MSVKSENARALAERLHTTTERTVKALAQADVTTPSTVMVGIGSRHGFSSWDSYASKGLEVTTSGSRTTIHAKALTGDAPLAVSASQEIGDEQDPFNYSRDELIEPPFDFSLLSALMTSSAIHSTCIETKASDYAYSGWSLTLRPEVQELIDSGKLSEDVLKQARQEATAFLSTCAKGQPIQDLMHDFAMDLESLGTACVELMRDSSGIVRELNHIPFATVRIIKSTAKKTKARFLQKRFNKNVFFCEFGDIVKFTADPSTIPLDEFDYERRDTLVELDGAKLLDPATGKPAASSDGYATELFVACRPPMIKSTVYGTPSGITALGDVLALAHIQKYNLDFFSSKGVPQYAVVVSKLTPKAAALPTTSTDPNAEFQGDDVAKLQQYITEFFTNRLQQSDRGVLIVTAFGEAEVKFEKLTDENAEGAFKEYELRAREMVRLAHRVPPAALGIAETANLGGGRDTAQLRRYRDHIVAPGQRRLATIVNRILREGLLIPYFEFAFSPLDIEEDTERRAFLLKEYESGAITPDEYREARDRSPMPEGTGGDVLYIRNGGVTTVGGELTDPATAARLQEQKLFSFMDALSERVAPKVAAIMSNPASN